MRRSILAIVLCVSVWTAAAVPAQARPERDRVSDRARLVAEHEPHRHLRGAEARLLQGRGHRPEDPAVRQYRPRDARQQRQGRLRLLVLGRRRLRARCRRRRHLGVRRAPAHGARDRLPRRPHRHQDAEGPRRQDLRGVRDARRAAAAADRDPQRRRQGDVQERHAQHVGLRRRLPRQGRLHPPARDLGGHPGAARRQAAQDVQARALRRATGVLRRDRLEREVPEVGRPGRAALPGRHDARLPVRGRSPARRGADPDRPQPAGPAAARARVPERRADGQELLQGLEGPRRHAIARDVAGLRALPVRVRAC